MKTGLYFGSFNPIHFGHLAIANYFVEFTDLDKVWFIISPHNPLKDKKTLLNNRLRLELVNIAINNDPRFFASDIEFKLPQPSYTIDTLTYLKEQHPNKEFVLIMGSDGLRSFHKWKNHEQIIKQYQRYVYPRHGETEDLVKNHPNIKVVDAPKIEISASFIRKAFKEKKDIRHFLPNGVYDAIDRYGYY